jgi:hypothetical protein
MQAREENVNDLTQILLTVGTAFEEVGSSLSSFHHTPALPSKSFAKLAP